MNLKNHVPAIAVALAMIAGFVAQNRGWLAADQLAMVFVALGLSGTSVAHRMPPPGRNP